VRAIDIDRLIEWLGPDGAIAGLEGSNLTVAELFELAIHYNLPVDKKTKRGEVINELVHRKSLRIEKTKEELQSMSYADLKTYFAERKVSKTELLCLLADFDIKPGSEAKKSLADFAAREITDIGMYQRVAKGKRNP